MKHMLLLLMAAAVLLCGCGQQTDEPDEVFEISVIPVTTETLPAAETVAATDTRLRDEILSLPTVEQFQTLDADAKLAAYNRTQAAYDAYMALSDEEKGLIPEAESIFETLFTYFNTLVAPLPDPTEALVLTDEDQQLLLKIGMAELGESGCRECIALVMRTVLNRVESERFPGTVHGVLYAQEQFTPVMDGSFHKAKPNEACHEALEMVMGGWDESQGALYYEFCEGESWHSQNLQLLLEHCNTRFYQ